jgi:hypothetical protein
MADARVKTTMSTFKALLFSAVLAGCTGSGAVRYSATAQVSTPELVEIEPGVMVVADYDEPVFYSEGVYWRYYGGIWYRSPYYNRAWVRVSAPPVAVRRIPRPEYYVRYRAQVRDHREARAYPPPAPEVRDHRTTPPAPAPTPLPPPDVRDHRGGPPMTPPGQNPVVRDQREERREDKAERREERREEKVERREERREDKAERREDKQERREDKAERREDKQERREDKRDDKRDKRNK